MGRAKWRAVAQQMRRGVRGLLLGSAPVPARFRPPGSLPAPTWFLAVAPAPALRLAVVAFDDHARATPPQVRTGAVPP